MEGEGDSSVSKVLGKSASRFTFISRTHVYKANNEAKTNKIMCVGIYNPCAEETEDKDHRGSGVRHPSFRPLRDPVSN